VSEVEPTGPPASHLGRTAQSHCGQLVAAAAARSFLMPPARFGPRLCNAMALFMNHRLNTMSLPIIILRHHYRQSTTEDVKEL